MKRAMKQRILSQWKQLEGEVRTRWSKLSSRDFQHIAGRRDKLAYVLSERYGLAQEEAARQVDEWIGQISFR